METKDIEAKEVKLTEHEKDILDDAFDIIARLSYTANRNKYFILNDEKIYTAKDIRLVLSMLEDLVDAERIVTE